jgi:hypothetical protein
MLAIGWRDDYDNDIEEDEEQGRDAAGAKPQAILAAITGVLS